MPATGARKFSCCCGTAGWDTPCGAGLEGTGADLDGTGAGLEGTGAGLDAKESANVRAGLAWNWRWGVAGWAWN